MQDLPPGRVDQGCVRSAEIQAAPGDAVDGSPADPAEASSHGSLMRLAVAIGAIPLLGLLAVRELVLVAQSAASSHALWASSSVVLLACMLWYVVRGARSVLAQIRLGRDSARLLAALRQQNLAAEQARDRAEQASRAKSLFFAAANHDLRQPLHSLGLFATALRNGNVDEAGRRLIEQILQCTESLEQLFDNLLDISRLDAGQVDMRREAVPANAILERLRSTHAASAQKKGLRLRVRRTRAVLHTDPTLLFRVLSNLVANAVRYTERGGIVVACRKRAGGACIEVWDSGIGIPAEQYERVFEEFYQLHNPGRDRSRGLGLGLATVRRLCRLLEHDLSLDSVVGRGSRFSIRVPLADPEHMPASASTVEQKVPNLIAGKLILVVDDEASVRLGMRSLLESWHCHCVTGADAQEALIALEGRVPDFILADLRLQAESGIEAIARLRARLGQSIPAVLISGDTATEQLRKVSAAGLTMMHKPLKPVRLRALLNHEFARRARGRNDDPRLARANGIMPR